MEPALADAAAAAQRAHSVHDAAAVDERAPLLAAAGDAQKRRKAGKPFYRPRPLWLVPFALIAAVVRGMTLAPRVQVFTQLSCDAVYHQYNHSHTHVDLNLYAAPSLLPSSHDHAYAAFAVSPDRCTADPAVQAGAARLQTMYTVIMGTLSAVTTGWWGHFSEKHGRTRVLAFATLGLLITDLTFILVSVPGSGFARHGHTLLPATSFFEGLFGGWSTIQAATTAYLSDCTSDGRSRAGLFSRFTGVFFLGFSVGPTIGAFFIRHPVFAAAVPQSAHAVTSVFGVAALCSLVNLFLVLAVFPESLHSKKGGPPVAAAAADDEEAPTREKDVSSWHEFVAGFAHVLTIFAPRRVMSGGRSRRDWRLPVLSCALLGYLLASGIYQLKYLYAEHVYEWGSEQLSYYITLASGLRAVTLLFIVPHVIAAFKPKAAPAPDAAAKKAQLAGEMRFDLLLIKVSFVFDVLSHVLVVASPAVASFPWYFVGFSVLSSFGSGAVPALQSLALCVVQQTPAAGEEGSAGSAGANAGKLFGALAALQSVGQMILGPMLFGFMYSRTVATHPQAIFVGAGCILSVSLALVHGVRAPRVRRRSRAQLEEEARGRSRATKDLRDEAAAAAEAAAQA